MRLYQTVEGTKLNELTSELFSYEYRDTDPVEEEIGKLFVESYNDDFIDPDTNLPRQRYSHTVGLLRQERSLDAGKPFDRLGFKGILRFKRKTFSSPCKHAFATSSTADISKPVQEQILKTSLRNTPMWATRLSDTCGTSTKYNPVGITSTSTIRCPFASLPTLKMEKNSVSKTSTASIPMPMPLVCGGCSQSHKVIFLLIDSDKAPYYSND